MYNHDNTLNPEPLLAGNSKENENNLQYLKLDLPTQQPHQFSKQLFARITWSILPLIFSMIVFCYVDRNNLSFAALQMFQDLHLNCATYGLGSGIFFISYSLFQVPSNFIVVRFGAPLWLGLIVCGWAITAILTATIRTEFEFVMTRFVMGIFEAGTFPGVWYYLSLFYPRKKLNIPYAVIDVGIYSAQVISAPMAAGLLAMDGVAGLRGWQWIFIAEGIPAAVIGILVFALLPKTPEKAKFLSIEENKWLENEIRRSQIGEEITPQEKKSSFQIFIKGISNLKVWYISLAGFLDKLTVYGILYWLPIIVYTLLGSEQAPDVCNRNNNQQQQPTDKRKQISAVLLTTIPYVFTMLAVYVNGAHSQYTQENRLHVGIPYVVSGTLFVAFIYLQKVNSVIAFVALIVTVMGATSTTPQQLNIVYGHSEEDTVHVTFAFFNTVQSFGGFFGPYFIGIVLQATGSYTVAVVVMGLGLVVAGVMIMCIDDPSVKKIENFVGVNNE